MQAREIFQEGNHDDKLVKAVGTIQAQIEKLEAVLADMGKNGVRLTEWQRSIIARCATDLSNMTK